MECKDPNATRDKAYEYGIVGIDFLSYDNFNPLHHYNRPVYIDELEYYLKHLNKDIQGYTLSNED